MRTILLLALLVAPAVAVAGPRWQPGHSPNELSAADAEAYCAQRGKGWRLPTRDELEQVRGKLPAVGFLWSGEDVSADRVGQRWIMNLRNRHIFNGHGRTGHAKCVRGPLPARVEHTLGPTYATIGPADAKLTVVVAVQPDYFWWKIRPTIDHLITKHSVRFDVRLYTVHDKFAAVGPAMCAAAETGKFFELEAKLRDPKTALDATALRALAIAAGANANQYDRALASCTKRVEVDRKALAQRGVEGVPSFFVGDTKLAGAWPDKLAAAVAAAAP